LTRWPFEWVNFLQCPRRRDARPLRRHLRL
jgi:hypothetical protein